ncbi:MAG: hypothetical protein C4524_06410 [Candidatus Zixiibacteriota bacterium]|nr:MAG: hypothetical protein C4524_06410 [candidate division Zixibacteria bacterium]
MNLTEFIAHAQEQPYDEDAYLTSFFGGTFEDALAAFKTGLLVNTDQFELDADRLFNALAEDTRIDRKYAVAGDFFDVGRIAEGHPEVWIKRKRTPVKPIINILAQIGFTGDIRTHQIYNRGVAIAALVKYLGNAGYPLNLQLLINFHRNRYGTYTAYIDFPSDPLDIDLLNYALTSRMFYRRLGFSFNNWLRRTSAAIDYGQCYLHTVPQDTLYFPCIEGYEYDTLDDARARITALLDTQLVTHQTE